MPNEPISAVLCGDLNMLRCFASTPIATAIVSSDPDDLALHSRSCRRQFIIADPFTQPHQALNDLVAVGKALPGRPVLFYGSDPFLLLVSRNRHALERYYNLLLPSQQLIEDLTSKVRFTSLAERLHLPVPATVLSHDVTTARQALRAVSLPCILKPNCHVGWSAATVAQSHQQWPQKALRADTLEQFERLFAGMLASTDDFVIQQYIPGDATSIYSFHTYFDRASIPLGYFVGRKIRTYPGESGISTYLQLVHEPQVVRLGIQILKTLNYVGLCKLDFKKDAAKNRFYLLEANARFTLWNYLGAASGVNLPILAYRDILALPCQPATSYTTGIRWLSFMNDLKTFLKSYHPDRQLSFAQWLLSLQGRKVYDVFSWRDPLPFMVSIIRDITMRSRRLIRFPRHTASDTLASTPRPTTPIP